MRTSLPLIPDPQVVPSKVCCQCEVCCRFPESDSALRPFFTEEEIKQAIARGIDSKAFPNPKGGQIAVVPHPTSEGYICPAFDPVTQHCGIYEHRPFDCQIYPFTIMWNEPHDTVLFAWDPLCPFLFEHVTGEAPTPGSSLPEHSQVLPPSLMDQAQTVARSLETSPFLAFLTVSPSLILPFQPEVVILQPLPLLTNALRS